jgi:hypothetical protein
VAGVGAAGGLVCEPVSSLQLSYVRGPPGAGVQMQMNGGAFVFGVLADVREQRSVTSSRA